MIFDIDRPSRGQTVLKQARLFRDDERSRFLKPLNQRDQIAAASRIDTANTQKDRPSACDEEEVINRRKLERLRFFAIRINIPIGLQVFLDLFAEPGQLIQVVTGRRQNDSEHQVAITRGKIFDARPHQITDAAGGDEQQRRQRRLDESALPGSNGSS